MGATRRGLFLLKYPHRQVARWFQSRLDCEVDGYAVLPMSGDESASCAEVLDIHTVIESVKRSTVPRDVLARARRIEVGAGVHLADAFASDRHLGLGWITGGLYHGGGLSRLPYEKHVQLLCETYDATLAFLERREPDFVCAPLFACFQSATLFFVCEKLGIPIRCLNGLSYGSYWCWTPDRRVSIPGIEEAMADLASRPPPPPETIADIAPRARRAVSGSLARGNLGDFAMLAAKAATWHARAAFSGYRKSDEIGLGAKLDYLWQLHRRARRELRRRYASIEDLSGTHFVYYPLQHEPEASLNGLEPYFTNQLYAIEILSKSIPADGYLVVKEHPGSVGKRPRGWIDRIAGFPRVRLVHPFESSIELIRRATATATIRGTVALEAAILGKPVVSLGSSYCLNLVGHVSHANDIPGLRRIFGRIWALCEEDLGRFRADGARLKRAIERTCLPLPDCLVNQPASDETVEKLAQALLRSIETSRARPT